jgi:hypothetical protein
VKDYWPDLKDAETLFSQKVMEYVLDRESSNGPFTGEASRWFLGLNARPGKRTLTLHETRGGLPFQQLDRGPPRIEIEPHIAELGKKVAEWLDALAKKRTLQVFGKRDVTEEEVKVSAGVKRGENEGQSGVTEEEVEVPAKRRKNAGRRRVTK